MSEDKISKELDRCRYGMTHHDVCGCRAFYIFKISELEKELATENLRITELLAEAMERDEKLNLYEKLFEGIEKRDGQIKELVIILNELWNNPHIGLLYRGEFRPTVEKVLKKYGITSLDLGQ